MTRIAEGASSLDDVVMESREMLTGIMEVLERERRDIGNEIKLALREQNTIGSCPQCGAGIVRMRSRRNKRFAGCLNYPDCRQSYPLPQRGRIEGSGEQCPECGSPRIALYSKGRGKAEFCVNLDCPTNAERLNNMREAAERRKKEAKEGGQKKGRGRGGRGRGKRGED
jgi:DNA topoisomerase-1